MGIVKTKYKSNNLKIDLPSGYSYIFDIDYNHFYPVLYVSKFQICGQNIKKWLSVNWDEIMPFEHILIEGIANICEERDVKYRSYRNHIPPFSKWYSEKLEELVSMRLFFNKLIDNHLKSV